MSSITRNQVFSAVHTIGSLLPADLLLRVSEGKDISGSTPSDYRVVGARSVRDEAERHWEFLRSVWADLRTKLPAAPQGEAPADPTGLAVSQWLMPLFTELGFGELTPLAEGIPADNDSKTFPITHRWNHVPIHIVSWNSELDKRPGGAGSVPPQSLVQELLNRTDTHLWGVVTNGRQVRILRDSNALSTASYVEFDLEAIFDGDLFSEFVLLYRMLHVSRFSVADGSGPATCWLERWRLDAISSGTRALDQLREGVENAVTTLGTGFLRHPANTVLRENVAPQELHRALLRLVYRMLFLFVVEDRGVLHPSPTAETEEGKRAEELARERYAEYFSTAKLRAHARRRRGSTHDDLFRALRLVLDALGEEHGRPELALPGLGGIFDRTEADAPLEGLSLSNEYLLSAIRHLSQVRDPTSKRLRTVDYRHLDAEELGSIYESLLERVPRHSAVDREFTLTGVAGNERKTTGSYYTPASLIECLLDSTLDPVLDDAVKRGEQRTPQVGNTDPSESIVAELLSLTVCDPACGSGHFLLAAARRIAKRVASVRERNPEPTIDSVRQALHEVIARCIYGVDLNPMAVELAKVSLWLEAMEPGKPLSFLDAHIKVGNALIGATPALIRKGIPDEAFKPIEGDDTKVARSLQNRNKKERHGQYVLFETGTETKVVNTAFADSLRDIVDAPAATLSEVRKQEADYRKLTGSTTYSLAQHIADAWCAAFLWPKTSEAPLAVTHDVFTGLQDPDTDAAPRRTHEEIRRLREQHRFFHWHLEFPDVFTVSKEEGANGDHGWSGGFDCVLGNPPWEHLELKEQEFFASRAPEIAKASGARRKQLINELSTANPDLHHHYAATKRQIDGTRHFIGNSTLFPLCGRGRIKTDTVFTEEGHRLTGPHGRMGVIVPTGIATDATTQHFFKNLVETGTLAALYDFENASGLFTDVHRSYKFCILSLTGGGIRTQQGSFAFFLHDPAELDDANKAFFLTPEEITLLNPNTGTCPVFRSRRDAEITVDIYRRVPVLVKEPDERGRGGSNPWGVSFMQGLFNMTSDSHLFHTREELEQDGWQLDGNVFTKDNKRMLPLYEAKMLHHYDHRWASYDANDNARELSLPEKQDPTTVALPRYWTSEHDIPTEKRDGKGNTRYESGVTSRLTSKNWDREWLLGWRDICRATDIRTMISSILGKNYSPEGGTLLALPQKATDKATALLAQWNSFAFDFVARQKVGGTHLKYFTIRQLPALTPSSVEQHDHFITPRVLELTYTAYDMTPFARDLDDTGPPFRWDEERRAVIRAELDALFFHLYGISREDADYILDTFPIVKRKDEAEYGTYRTKELILAEYDRMEAAGVSLDTPLVDGDHYTSTLTPPPGQGPRHPSRSTS
ncbi:Eco57I restriction-modification methylase domain-containing protein [Actinopolyspora mortivallis]|uniref:site-specific DNA-methyltransferase (adenine-specific) n=1 Tax=Actinopolyspora mortivallis TaxID=33906 RepID=A0A2T0H1W1_ACTMO|nr:N-6 DNA methylase [Actinopolyspora mortivallis]PRW65369.1 restriction endonuclease [Actinopolyspora mortivallis]